jgi:dolichol-phosphate mannosyltransferase
MVTHPLRLYVRHCPLGGLSGAVIEGFRHARGEVVVVMDGDLQHPPEAICSLIDPVLCGRAELAIGSRAPVGGTIQRHRQPAGRRLASNVAKMLAWPLTAVVADPMSGFFAVSPAALARAQPLDPVGYKIALELICKCRFSGVTEVPFEFGLREAGRSKLTTKEYWNYLRHLARLYRHRLRMLTTPSTD